MRVMTYLTLDAHKHERTHSGATFSTPAFFTPEFSTPAFSVARVGTWAVI